MNELHVQRSMNELRGFSGAAHGTLRKKDKVEKHVGIIYNNLKNEAVSSLEKIQLLPIFNKISDQLKTTNKKKLKKIVENLKEMKEKVKKVIEHCQEEKKTTDRMKGEIKGLLLQISSTKEGKKSIQHTLNQVNETEQIELLQYIKQIYGKQKSTKAKITAIKVIRAFSWTERENLFDLATKVDDKALFFKTFAKIKREDASNVLKCAQILFKREPKKQNAKKFLEKIARLIDKITPGERKELLDYFQNFPLIELKSSSILLSIAKIPQGKRASTVSDFIGFPGLTTLLKRVIGHNQHGFSIHPIIFYSLLPDHLKDRKRLESIKECFIEDEEYRTAVVDAIRDVLEQRTSNRELVLQLSQYLVAYHKELSIQWGEPVLEKALTVTLEDPESRSIDNPFRVIKKLYDFRKEPINFLPPRYLVAKESCRIDIEKIQLLAKSRKMERSDLPKESIIANWDLLRERLEKKIKANESEAKKLFKELGTSREKFEESLKAEYLKSLFRTEGFLSDAEIQWKAIFKSIWDKNTIPKNGKIFSEQDEALIATLVGIKNCSIGQDGGIAATYAVLDKKYQFNVTLATETDVADIEQKRGKEAAIDLLHNFYRTHQNATSKDLMNFVNDPDNIHDATGVLRFLIGEEQYWNIEEDTTLNNLGAEQLLKIFSEKKNETFINRVVKGVIESQFIGESKLLCALTKKRKKELKVHDGLYAKNLIGALATNGVVFDKYTFVVDKHLINMDRNTAVNIFFEHVTPQILVDNLKRAVKSDEERVFVKRVLPERSFWRKGEITDEGALELLKRAKYLTH